MDRRRNQTSVCLQRKGAFLGVNYPFYHSDYSDICKKPEFQGRTKNAVAKAYKRKVQEAQELFTPEIVPAKI